MGLFIPTSKLENLKLYKYSSEDHSLISRYILKRWWNSFVLIFPLNMAPNVITLLGLVWVILNVICVLYFDPYLDTPLPRWCYFFYAFGLFMYQTFDGCDGCHARRTGQSGPLGELFDHSIDAINTTLGIIVFALVFQLGYGWLLLLAQFAATCNFYTSTWEEYHTHTLFLSKFSGPVEGILMICGLYVVTGIFGPEIWKKDLFDLDLRLLGWGVYSLDTSLFYIVVGLGLLYFNIAAAMANVARKYKAEKKTSKKVTNAEKKTRNVEFKIHTAYHGLIPFFAYYASVILLVYQFPDALSKYAFPLVTSIGLTIAFCVGRIILAHLTVQEFPLVQLPTFLPTAQLVTANLLIKIFGYDQDKTICGLIWTGMGLTMGIHSMFVADIINDITTYLDIYALSIKHRKVY